MNKRIQSGVSAFDEVTFPTKPSMWTLVLRIIGFNIIVVGFNPTMVVGNIAIGVSNVKYFVKVDLYG